MCQLEDSAALCSPRVGIGVYAILTWGESSQSMNCSKYLVLKKGEEEICLHSYSCSAHTVARYVWFSSLICKVPMRGIRSRKLLLCRAVFSQLLPLNSLVIKATWWKMIISSTCKFLVSKLWIGQLESIILAVEHFYCLKMPWIEL